MNKDLILAAFAVSIISLISGALLTVVENVTSEPRRKIEKQKIEDGLSNVFPENVEIEQKSPIEGKKIDELEEEQRFFIFNAEDNREYKLKVWTAYKKQLIASENADKTPRIPVARAYLTGAQGYGGKVMLLLGVKYNQFRDYKTKKFEISGSIKNYVIQEMSKETPGLGTIVAEEKFVSQWRGLSLGKELNLKMSGGKIDAITGATISSDAVNKAIRAAMELDAKLRNDDKEKYFDAIMKFDKVWKENQAEILKTTELAKKIKEAADRKKLEEEKKIADAEKLRIAKEKEKEAKRIADEAAKKSADAESSMTEKYEKLEIEIENLKKQNAEKAKQIKQLTDELKKMKAELEKKPETQPKNK
ncbi:MAG: FMN-binding protein [Planctomycetes bacterium]|nr:FMN-binding protein [Planctomycetota bacterium]